MNRMDSYKQIMRMNTVGFAFVALLLCVAGGAVLRGAFSNSTTPYLIGVLLKVASGGLVLSVILFSLRTARKWLAPPKVQVAIFSVAIAGISIGLFAVELPEEILWITIAGSWFLAGLVTAGVYYLESLYESVRKTYEEVDRKIGHWMRWDR